MAVTEAPDDFLRFAIRWPTRDYNDLGTIVSGDFVMYNTHSAPVRKKIRLSRRPLYPQYAAAISRNWRRQAMPSRLGTSKTCWNAFSAVSYRLPPPVKPPDLEKPDRRRHDRSAASARAPVDAPFFIRTAGMSFTSVPARKTVRIGNVSTFGLVHGSWSPSGIQRLVVGRPPGDGFKLGVGRQRQDDHGTDSAGRIP